MTVIDGRNARRARTREALLDAVIAVVEDGDEVPTARRVAARAGVGERTLFQHFPDLEALHAAVAARHVERALARHRRIPADLPFDERVRTFAAQRARALEAMTPLRRAALRFEADSPALQASRERWSALARAELTAVFAVELDAIDDRRTVVAAASAATSWASWDELRTTAGLGVAAAAKAMELTLRGLLTA